MDTKNPDRGDPALAIPFVGGPFCGNVCAAFTSEVPALLHMPGCSYRLVVTPARDGSWVQIRYVVSPADKAANWDGMPIAVS